MPRCKVRKRRKYQECGGATCPHLLQSWKGIKRSEAPRWYMPASTIVLSGDDASVCAAFSVLQFCRTLLWSRKIIEKIKMWRSYMPMSILIKPTCCGAFDQFILCNSQLSRCGSTQQTRLLYESEGNCCSIPPTIRNQVELSGGDGTV